MDREKMKEKLLQCIDDEAAKSERVNKEEKVQDEMIKDIYLGNMNPADWEIENPEYKNKLEEYVRGSDDLLKYIPKELHEKFDEVCLKRAEIIYMEEENAFVKGFRIGAKLMLEMIGGKMEDPFQ